MIARKLTTAGLALSLLGVGFCLGTASGQSQAELNQKSADELRAAEARLKATYRQLLATTSGEQRALVATAETAWLKYRDANCKALAFPNKGGSIYPLVYSSAQTRMTDARNQEMSNQLSELRAR